MELEKDQRVILEEQMKVATRNKKIGTILFVAGGFACIVPLGALFELMMDFDYSDIYGGNVLLFLGLLLLILCLFGGCVWLYYNNKLQRLEK